MPETERVKLVIDCWRKVDTITERIFRGLYVRCFLILTDNRIIELKTSHYDIKAPTKPPSLEAEDPLSYLIWGPLNYLFHLEALENLKKEGELVRETLGTGVSLEEALIKIQQLKRKLGIWSISPSKTILYNQIVNVEVKKGEITINVAGKTIKYFCPALTSQRQASTMQRIIKQLILG